MPIAVIPSISRRNGVRRRLRPGNLRDLGLKLNARDARVRLLGVSHQRIGLVGNPQHTGAPGGGEIQLVETGKALRNLKLHAHPWRAGQDCLDSVDVLHLFGSHPAWLPLARAARRAGKRVALSTIAWFDLASRWHEPNPWSRRLRGSLGYLARAAFPKMPDWRRRLYQAADVLLPNSAAEAEQLVRLFGIPRERVRVVVNGAAPQFAEGDPKLFAQRAGGAGFVLCAGRIEPRKNQLTLIQALASSTLRLVVLGDVVPGHEAYAEACRQAAGPRVQFMPALKHDDPLLASALAACGCLALASWFETPGLAALEAAMSGKPLVLTDRGATREYFGPLAHYVEPADRSGWRTAIELALAAGPNPLLAEMTQQRYTWRAAATATREAYASIL